VAVGLAGRPKAQFYISGNPGTVSIRIYRKKAIAR
jgi:hypothetical protein